MSSVHDCAVRKRVLQMSNISDVASLTLSTTCCDGVPKNWPTDARNILISPQRMKYWTVDEYFSNTDTSLPNMDSAWLRLNRIPDDEPLRVGVDRRVRPQLLKYKNSPAVLIPTGLVCLCFSG